MGKPRTEEPPIIAAIRREVTAELRHSPPEYRTEERIKEATFHRLALRAPDLFKKIRRFAHSFRDREGRAFRAMLDEIHGEYWEQPPITSDRVISLSLDANYGEPDGRPAKGSVLRQLDDSESERARLQLDALTLRLNVTLNGEPWHKNVDLPLKSANKALAAAFRLPEFDIDRTLLASQSLRMPGEAEHPDVAALIAWHGSFAETYREAQRGVLRELSAVILEIIEEMENERAQRYKTPRGMRVHRPQEWAARALLRLRGRSEPIPWEDVKGLLKALTRDARP